MLCLITNSKSFSMSLRREDHLKCNTLDISRGRCKIYKLTIAKIKLTRNNCGYSISTLLILNNCSKRSILNRRSSKRSNRESIICYRCRICKFNSLKARIETKYLALLNSGSVISIATGTIASIKVYILLVDLETKINYIL